MTLKEFYELAHGDYDDMFERVPDDSLIEEFIETYANMDLYSKMIEAFLKKDYEELFKVTHEYKGVAANMGFKGMSNAVSAVCESVRHGAPTVDINGIIAEAKAEYEIFVRAYNEYSRG